MDAHGSGSPVVDGGHGRLTRSHKDGGWWTGVDDEDKTSLRLGDNGWYVVTDPIVASHQRQAR